MATGLAAPLGLSPKLGEEEVLIPTSLEKHSAASDGVLLPCLRHKETALTCN